DGVIQVNPSSGGGARAITGTLTTAGTINFNTNATLGSTGANHINTGLFNLPGVTVTVVGNSFTNGNGGLISGTGTINAPGVSLVNSGGVVVNTGTLSLISSSATSSRPRTPRRRRRWMRCRPAARSTPWRASAP